MGQSDVAASAVEQGRATEVEGTVSTLTQADRAKRTDPSVLKDLLEKMLLVRRFEEKSAEMYTLGKIGGFCHLYIGQEAVGAGAISALNADDFIHVSGGIEDNPGSERLACYAASGMVRAAAQRAPAVLRPLCAGPAGLR